MGREITHQPSVVTDSTGQLVFAQAAAGVLGAVAEAAPNKVREVWVFRAGTVVTDPTGQHVFALTAAVVLGTVAEATPNKVRQVWVFRVWDSD